MCNDYITSVAVQLSQVPCRSVPFIVHLSTLCKEFIYDIDFYPYKEGKHMNTSIHCLYHFVTLVRIGCNYS